MTKYYVLFSYDGKEFSGEIESSLDIVDSSDRLGAMNIAEMVVKAALEQPCVKKEGKIPTEIRVVNAKRNSVIAVFKSFKESPLKKD